MYPSGTLAEEDEERGFGMDENNGTEEPFKGVERRDNINISIEHDDLISDCQEEPVKVKFKPIPMGRIAYAARGASATSSVESSRSLFGGLSRHNSTVSNIGCWENDINSGDYWIPPENECNKNDPLAVDFRCACFKLTDISTVHFTTLLKFVVVFEWCDSRLKGMPITTNDLPGDLWGPDIILENAQEDCTVVYDSFSLLNAKQGRLKRTVTFHGRVFTPMELKDFPFDAEELTLKFISINNWRTLDQKRHGNDPVNHVYILRPMLDRKDVDFFVPGWGGKIQEFNMLRWSQDVKNTSNPAFPIVFKFNFHLVRIASFYVYKILFPLWLITISSMVTFGIDTQDLQGRLEVLFTLMLSTIALMYVVQEQIPKISFLTMIDKIVNATLFNLALSVLFSYLVSTVTDPGRMNMIMSVTNQVVYWIANIAFIIPPYMRFRKTIREQSIQTMVQKKTA